MSTTRKRLPPLQTLEAFDVTARLLSFTRAGQEINLSQSAVSRQIKLLEESLGVLLFIRRHKVLELTKAGRTLQDGIQRSLSELRRTVETIQSEKHPTITISARYAIHEPHLPQEGATVYRGISGGQFHGSKAS